MTLWKGTPTAPSVDIRTGEVTQLATDFRRDGLLPLCLERFYSSQAHREPPYRRAAEMETSSAFGTGWRSSWDHSLRRTLHGFLYCRPDGHEIELRSGLDGRVQHIGHRIELEGIDGNHVRLVEYARGRAHVSHVFASTANGAKWDLQAIEYRSGNRIVVIRDETGRVLRLEHSRARCALVVSYLGGKVACVDLHTEQGGRHFVLGYKYHPSGLLLEVHDRSGCAVAYAYDNDGRLIREDKHQGGIFVLSYDREGRCSRIGGQSGYQTRHFSYDPPARYTRMSDSTGESWLYEFDVNDNLSRTVSPLGGEECFVFDRGGLLQQRVHVHGHVSTYFYDEHGRLYGQRDANATTYWEYDSWHRITEKVDPYGVLVARYSDEHDLMAVGRPGALWTFAYNTLGERVSITNPKGGTRSILYDQCGNRVAEGDFLGNYTHFEYDDFGRCTKTTGPTGGVEERTYDELDRVTTSTLSGTLSRSHHDGENSIVVDATGAKSSFRRDAYGRTLEHRDSEGLVCQLRWGSEPSQILSMIDGAGHEETVLYDAEQRIVQVRTRDGRLIVLEYDEFGASSATTHNPTSGSTEFAASRRASFEYDGQGRLVRATSGDQVRRFEYDLRGQVVRFETEEIVVTRTYNEDGWRTDEGVYSRAAPGAPERIMLHIDGTVDSLGRTTQFVCGGAPTVMMEWDENGRALCVDVDGVRVDYKRSESGAETERRASGMRLLMKRDRDGRETEWLYDIDGQPPARIQASYGSRRPFPSHLSVVTAHGEQSALIRSDGRGRVRAIVSQGEGSMSRFFVYDGAGNWTLHASSLRGRELLPRLESAGWDRAPIILSHYADETAYATALPGGRLDTLRTGPVTIRYRWDDFGRATEKVVHFGDEEDVWRYEYDGWDLLRHVQTPLGLSYAYRYDALGRLIDRRSSTGTRTELIWDDERILHVLVEGEAVETRVHHPGTGELLLQRFSNGAVDVRPSRLRELEELLGSTNPGSSVEPSSEVPRVAIGVSPSVRHPVESTFLDSEARVAIGIHRCWDVETSYDLTWRRGQPAAQTLSTLTRVLPIIERGAAELAEISPLRPKVLDPHPGQAFLADLLRFSGTPAIR
ncbi:DUF6531 domain-containing protein [Pendulispora brunnea]|uniref:DUF6531 domain-containing protein n=1 Tax=Pendulispora brunnea TaxID=2905690 RepID=A0ABZ2KKE1_9BACT